MYLFRLLTWATSNFADNVGTVNITCFKLKGVKYLT